MCLLAVLAEQTRAQGWPLWAFHIHHGLQSQADDWVGVVRDYCTRLGVVFDVCYLDPNTRKSAQSIEEWARRGRYRALTELAWAHGVNQIALAHHEDDQIETYLLQKQRGAGARGLSAMPKCVVRDGVTWLRPWLGVCRAQIEHYAQAHSIVHINDPSNTDTRFTRNAIRAQLKASPISDEQRYNILNAITQAQSELVREQTWAREVLLAHRCPHREDLGECGRLHAIDLSRYTQAEQNELLREWMAQLGWRMPARSALAELIKQLQGVKLNTNMCWHHSDGGAVTRLKNQWIAAQILPSGQWFITAQLRERIEREHLSIRTRLGGERFRLAPNRPHISLKHAYQTYEVAPMLRRQLPLLYQGENLVHVVGVGDVCV